MTTFREPTISSQRKGSPFGRFIHDDVRTVSDQRDLTLDAIRGAAIVLMILDHALALAQGTDLVEPWMHLVRVTATRFSMPAFMVCSGILLARRTVSRRRWLQVAGAALVVNAGAIRMGMGSTVPEILAIWTLVMLVASPIRRWPMTMAVLGLVQAAYWRVPFNDYQPGWVMAFVALGVLVERSGDSELLEPAASRLPKWTATVGRRPLTWYLGHLVVLAGLTIMGQEAGWW